MQHNLNIKAKTIQHVFKKKKQKNFLGQEKICQDTESFNYKENKQINGTSQN